MKRYDIMKLVRTALAVVCCLVLCSACTGMYGDYNTNPNELTDEDLERDYLNSGMASWTQMQMNIFPIGDGSNPYQRVQNLAGDIYAGYMAGNNSWESNYNNCTYYLVDGWVSVSYEKTFKEVMSAWKRIQGIDQEKNPASYAVAQIMKVLAVSRLTDMFGPLPYFGFGQNPGMATPYDSQRDIYSSFFTDLDGAIEVLNEFISENPGAKPGARFDLVYDGDYEKWVKLAASLKLRLAMRLYYVDQTLAREKAEEVMDITKTPNGVLTLASQTAAVHSKGSTVIAHPLKMLWDNYSDTRMGATMDSYLNGYGDPRLPKYFKKAAYSGTGARDYIGLANGTFINATNRETYKTFSCPNFDGAEPVQWMCAAEVWFLRAEGAMRGWTMGGTAEELYNQGIKTSFEQHGATGADSYLANTTAKPVNYVEPGGSTTAALGTVTVKWVDGDPEETRQERIITQKWIAMYPDGQEAWSEFRRTGYPKLFPVKTNYSFGAINSATQIRRLKYPLSQYDGDGATVMAGVVNNADMLDGPDTGGTKLWWDKK